MSGISLTVLNAGWLGRPCPLPAHNLTLSPTPFSISPSNRILSFFFNCNPLVPRQLKRHYSFHVPCNSSHTGDSFAVLDYSQKLDPLNLSGKCGPSVTLPVLKESYEKLRPDGNYSDLVEKGFLLEWTAVDCRTCMESGGQCGYNKSLSRFQCYCADRPHLVKCRSNTKWKKKKILLGTLPALRGSILLFLFIWLCCHARRSPLETLTISLKKGTYETRNVEAFLRNYDSLAPKRYRYSELKKITNSFEDKLGQGGYGGVFKGKLHDGRLVAVKVLNESSGGGEEFVNEVASIGRTNHVNIVALLGFCYERSRRALVYEFMPNGSLDKFIYSEDTGARHLLSFEKLFQIAVGIARGLEYLHRGCSMHFLHFDIKPHKILLDRDFCPKISDFGLAKTCPKQVSAASMLDPRGTIGYIAPEVVL